MIPLNYKRFLLHLKCGFKKYVDIQELKCRNGAFPGFICPISKVAAYIG